MFGRMSVDAILSVERGCDPFAAVRVLVERTEGVKVIKWIEFPDSILVFLMIPGDMTSGSIYVLDANRGCGTGLTSRTIITGDIAERNWSGC